MIIVMIMFLITFLGPFVVIRKRIYGLIISFFYFILPTVSSAIFPIFKCVELNFDSYLIADLSIKCTDTEYYKYKKAVYFGVLLYPVFIPLLFFYMLCSRREILIYNKKVEKCIAACNHPDLYGIRLSSRYEFLEPLEALYGRYKDNLYWFDILDILYRLCLTTFIRAWFESEEMIALVSVLFTIVWMLIQERVSPYKYKLENNFTLLSKTQVFIVYFAFYIKVNNGLSFKGTYKLTNSMYVEMSSQEILNLIDYILIIMNGIVILFLFRYLYLHFHNKFAPMNAIIPTKNKVIEDIAQENTNSRENINWIMELDKDIQLSTLLRLQGIIFFRLSSFGIHSLFKQLSIVNIDSINESFYSIDNAKILPSKLKHIDLKRCKGDATIFAGQPRVDNEKGLTFWLKGGFSSLYINSLKLLVGLHSWEEGTFKKLPKVDENALNKFYYDVAVLIQKVFRGYIIRYPRPPQTPPIFIGDVLDDAVSSIGSCDTFVSFDGFDNEDDRKRYYQIRKNKIFVPGGVDPKYFWDVSDSSSDGVLEKIAKQLLANKKEQSKLTNSPNLKDKFDIDGDKKKNSPPTPDNINGIIKDLLIASNNSNNNNNNNNNNNSPSSAYSSGKNSKYENRSNRVHIFSPKASTHNSPTNKFTSANFSLENMTGRERKKWERDKKMFMFEIAYDSRLESEKFISRSNSDVKRGDDDDDDDDGGGGGGAVYDLVNDVDERVNRNAKLSNGHTVKPPATANIKKNRKEKSKNKEELMAKFRAADKRLNELRKNFVQKKEVEDSVSSGLTSSSDGV